MSVFPGEQSLNFQSKEGASAIVLKLVDDRLSHWRKRFGERGLEAIDEVVFNKLTESGLENNTANRRWWCTWALSHGDDTCRPFYYMIYNEPDTELEGSEAQPTIKGIFQSSLVATILGTHMQWLAAVSDNVRTRKWPVGALVHSIQAAKRAISWWETGEQVRPNRPLNEYSKANWGDHFETREGQMINITSTSSLIALVSKLKDKQWVKILAAARSNSKRKKHLKLAAVSEPPVPLYSAAIVLRDDDSDLAEENELP